jgi:hypothetical protein
VTIDSWKILYNRALQSESETLLDANRMAVDAILQRMMFLTFGDMSTTMTKTREQRALCIALSDLRVLRTAFSALRW